MTKTMNREELLLAKLKNEDKILELRQENLIIERELAKLEIENRVPEIPDSIVRQVAVSCHFSGRDLESELNKIRENSRKRYFSILEGIFERKINEIKEMRQELAMMAQQIIASKNQAESESEKDEELEALLKLLASKLGVQVIKIG